MTVDFNNTSQYGSPFSVSALNQDGFATGRLSGIDFSDTGVITSRFTNGQSRTLGQIAVATFNNTQGLRQLGDTSWAESFDSGAPLVGAPAVSVPTGQLPDGLPAGGLDVMGRDAMVPARRLADGLVSPCIQEPEHFPSANYAHPNDFPPIHAARFSQNA